MQNINPSILNFIRKYSAESIANELVNVQPMPSTIIRDFKDASMSEEELIKQGYEPVDPSSRLMWKKKNDEENS